LTSVLIAGLALSHSARRPFFSVIPIALLLIFLVAALLYLSTCMADGNGKNVKVLSLVNCGMGAAVDIGVISEHVLGFSSAPLPPRLRLGEADLFYAGYWSGGPQRKQYPDDFVSEFALERR
jgi:hypothetical protein